MRMVFVSLVVATGCAERALPLPEPEAALDGSLDEPTQVDMTTEDDDPTLIDLQISHGELSPAFAPLQTSYSAEEPIFIEMITLTPTAKSRAAMITVKGQPVLSGMASQMISLSFGMNPIAVQVTTPSGKMKLYSVLVTRGSAIDYLKASNTGGEDLFGRSVALSGDTLVVGAPREDSKATGVNGDQTNEDAQDSGAVYVFIRSGATWAQQAYLKASNPGAGDQFGWSVALSGETLAVGAPTEASSATGVDGDQSNDNAQDSGAVYIFTRTGTTWTEQAYLKASNTSIGPPPNFGDTFGTVVALSGDTLAVGALNEDSKATGVNGDQTDNSATNSGAVYVFTRSGTTWKQQAYLKASNTGGNQPFYPDGDLFGTSVALSGDTLAVGAPNEASNATGVNGNQTDNSAVGSGAVYVFTRSGTMWTQQAYVKSSHTKQAEQFGYAVSISGDTLVVGAPDESGATYVFTRSGTTWSQQAYLTAPKPYFLDHFGSAVALLGDILAVGARGDSSTATGVNETQVGPYIQNTILCGAAYLFSRAGATWTQQAYVKASNTGKGDSFGVAIALSEDHLVAAAPLEESNATGVNGNQTDNSAPWSGAVYVY